MAKHRSRKRSGGKGTHYYCEYCLKPFATRNAAAEHEVSSHGRQSSRSGGFKGVAGHKGLMPTCFRCGGPHTTSAHASHGHGARKRTHPGYY